MVGRVVDLDGIFSGCKSADKAISGRKKPK